MLSDKEKRFCLEYVTDLNATQAAIRAGYSKKTSGVIGYENLKKPHIIEEIERLQKPINDNLKLNAEWITERLMKVVNMCMQEEAVFDKQGFPTGEYKFDSAGANKSLELLGKRIGYFEVDNNQKGLKFKVSVKK